MSILVVEGLRKRYGALEAVRDISFSVEEGEVFALIGPNGAGKTTTLRMVATILRPDGGRATLAGFDVVNEPELVRERISYLPEEAGAYRNMTGDGYIRFMADILVNGPRERDEAIARASEISGLGERLRSKIGTYSKGMARKLLLARALMARPALAILDEPTSGLDVLNALEIRDTIRRATESGMSVLLSSHNMLEIEYLSDRVAIVHEGTIRAIGSAAELKERFGGRNLEEVFARVVSN